jgi:hypothetical protein
VVEKLAGQMGGAGYPRIGLSMRVERVVGFGLGGSAQGSFTVGGKAA